MQKNVRISLTGMRADGAADGTDKETVVLPAVYYYKNGKHYLSYEETDRESGEKTRTLLKFTDRTLNVHRRGAAESELLFEKGRATVGQYGTPAGALVLDLFASDFELRETEEEIRYSVQYGIGSGRDGDLRRIILVIRPDVQAWDF